LRSDAPLESFAFTSFDESGNLLSSAIVESHSDEQLFSNLADYSGDVHLNFYDKDGDNESISIAFVDGVVSDVMYHFEEVSNGRLSGGACKVRRIAYCTGKEFEKGGGINGGFSEKLGCYTGFGLCFLYRFLDCGWNLCLADDFSIAAPSSGPIAADLVVTGLPVISFSDLPN